MIGGICQGKDKRKKSFTSFLDFKVPPTCRVRRLNGVGAFVEKLHQL